MKQITHMRVSVGGAGGVPLLQQRSLLGAGVHGPTHSQASLHFNLRKHRVISVEKSPPNSPARRRTLGVWFAEGVNRRLSSKLIRFTNRCSTRSPGCNRRMYSGQERGCQHFLNHRLAPARWACSSFRGLVSLSFRV